MKQKTQPIDEVKQSKRRPGPAASFEKLLPVVVIPRAFSIRGAASYAGVTTWFMECAVREHRICSFIAGKRRLILRDECDRFLEEQNAKARKEQGQLHEAA